MSHKKSKPGNKPENKTNEQLENKPDNSVKVQVIATIGAIIVALITGLIALLKPLEQKPITPSPENQVILTSTDSNSTNIYIEDFFSSTKYLDADCQNSNGEWGALCSIANDAFRWQVTGKKNTTAFLEINFPPISDFDLETTINLVNYSPKGWYGIWFRGDDANGAYFFMLDSDGRYELTKYIRSENSYENIIGWTKDSAVNLNLENRLKIVAVGHRIRLYINSSLVGDIIDNSFSTGKLKLVSWMDSDRSITIDVSEFKLTLLPP